MRLKRSKKSTRIKKPRKIRNIIDDIDDLLLQKLIKERGGRCQICGGFQRLGLFHILPKGAHPRLRFYERNILVAGWFCCHLPFHHSYYEARDRIIPRIKAIVGENYELELLDIERGLPRLDRIVLEELLKTMEKV